MHIKSVSMLQDYFSPRGYTFEQMTIGEAPRRRFVTMKSPEGAYITLSSAVPTYPFTSASGREIFIDKTKAYDLAKLLGISIPSSYVVTTERATVEALSIMLSTHQMLIAKPHNSYQSRGLTTNITTVDQLKAAIEQASEISEFVLVQQQVTGEELRFIALDGAIRSVLLRQKAFVVGDSTSTVAELIAKENEIRRTIIDSKVAYPQLDASLIAHDLLTSDRIPDSDERVELNTMTMIRGGASVYDVFKQVHPSYLEVAQRLAERFGKGFMAVDLMIQDYTQPATLTNYVMLELNGSISLPMCYSCRDGRHFRIIEDYLGPMLERAIATQ